jgi:protein-disulfide isomerase
MATPRPIASQTFAACLVLALSLLGRAPVAAAADAPADPRMVEHTLGNPKAPVRIDEYYSLDCPHCADFEINTLPKLKADYIDKGKVYLVLHDFPLHPLALAATQIARCLPPDHFLPMVDALFKVQQGWILQTMGASTDALKQQAKFAGLSDAQATACLNDSTLGDAILDERIQAEKNVGIEATPTFIFNQNKDDRIEAPGPYDLFTRKIDALLKK